MTTSVTHCGIHDFRVMPFGMKNTTAGASVSHAGGGSQTEPYRWSWVHISLHQQHPCLSKTLDEHIHHLKLVISWLLENQLKLKPVKCNFLQQEVGHLGHVLTPQGLKTSKENIHAVEFSVPRDVHNVRHFLRLASFYRRFIPLFARIDHPLHALTRKGAVFEWTSECQEAFDVLKSQLINSPVLALPHWRWCQWSGSRGCTLSASRGWETSSHHIHQLNSFSCERNYGITAAPSPCYTTWACSSLKFSYDLDIHTWAQGYAAAGRNPDHLRGCISFAIK